MRFCLFILLMFHVGMKNFWLILLSAVLPFVKGHGCPGDFCVCTNAVTNCSNRNLATIPVGISINVHRLYLNNNSISLLEDPNGHLTKLTLLDLRWNKITSLVDHPFQNYSGLRELYLDHNEISELGNAFDHLELTIKRLSLSYNKISGNVSEHVFTYLETLEYLNVSHNQIAFFEARSFHNTLLELDISYNNIMSLDPEKFYDLTNLRYLDMRGLQIDNFEVKIFAHMKSLKRLRLGGSRMINISESVFFGLNGSLETLEIVDSLFISLPANLLVHCSNIKTLVISNNKITSLEKIFFDNAPNLIHLNLEKNRLYDGNLIAKTLEPLNMLSILDLTSNQLTESYAIIVNTLSNLIDVSFAKNQLQIVNESLVSSSLQKLDLSYNAIHAVDVSSLDHCSRLALLDLSANDLMSLPKIQSSSSLSEAFVDRTRYLEITVSDNPWNCSCEFYRKVLEANASTYKIKLVCAEQNDLSCLRCGFPVNLTNVSVADLPVYFPGCVTENHQSIDLTALYIVLVLLFVITIVLIVCFCLKRESLKTEASARQDSTICTLFGNKKNTITLYCCCMRSNEEQKRQNLQNKRQVKPKPLPQNNNTCEITVEIETSLSVSAKQVVTPCDNCSCQNQVVDNAVAILNENTNSCKPVCSCRVKLSDNNGSSSNRHVTSVSEDALLSANFEDLKMSSMGPRNEDLNFFPAISVENQKSTCTKSNQNDQNCLSADVESAKNHHAIPDE